MAFKSVIYFILIAVTLINFETVNSLACYSCVAHLGNNSKCEDLSNKGANLLQYECTYGDAVCAKYIIEYGDSFMIHRGCQHNDICAVLAKKYNNLQSKVVDCQTCLAHDYCNSSSVIEFMSLLLVLLLCNKLF